MPYFRAQMNCVPGMVTEFAFEPFIQLLSRELPLVKKVANINAIRAQKSIGLVAQGKAALDLTVLITCFVTRFVVHRIITCR
jgi:cytochrome c oxidase subunit 2